jgi:hypothetical protein
VPERFEGVIEMVVGQNLCNDPECLKRLTGQNRDLEHRLKDATEDLSNLKNITDTQIKDLSDLVEKYRGEIQRLRILVASLEQRSENNVQ